MRLVLPGALAAVLLTLAASPAPPQDPAASPGPILYGDGAGRLWKWQDGAKTEFGPPGASFGGLVDEKTLWGFTTDRQKVRFFTLALPEDPKDPKAPQKTSPPAAPEPEPVYDLGVFPTPDLADRRDDFLLLTYGALSPRPRIELWQAGVRRWSRTFDDGRTVLAAALGPGGQTLVAGRSPEGLPWLEVNGNPAAAPEGWRGRLTVAAWVAEAPADDPKADTKADPKADPKAKQTPAPPPPVHPWAAGWGAQAGERPQALVWGPGGWVTALSPEGLAPAAGVYPLVGGDGGQGALVLGGWWADAAGLTRPWFWDGTAATVPGTAAEGTPVAVAAGTDGAFLVVRHETAPWFTREDGMESVPLEGLSEVDRVRVLAPGKVKVGP